MQRRKKEQGLLLSVSPRPLRLCVKAGLVSAAAVPRCVSCAFSRLVPLRVLRRCKCKCRNCHLLKVTADSVSKTPVVGFMGADPFPEKDGAAELADGAVVVAHTHRPVGLADGFEVQRGMECVRRPEAIILLRQQPDLGGQGGIEPPEFRRAAAREGHGSWRMSLRRRVWPAAWAASASRFRAENLAPAASAFIWRSQSSSVQPQSSAMIWARSSSESLSIAVLISSTVLILRHYALTTQSWQRRFRTENSESRRLKAA